MRNHIPAQLQSHVPVPKEPLSIIKEVVFGGHIYEVQDSRVSSDDDLVPQNYLVDHILSCGVVDEKYNKQLFGIPIKQVRQISFNREFELSMVLLLRSRCHGFYGYIN